MLAVTWVLPVVWVLPMGGACCKSTFFNSTMNAVFVDKQVSAGKSSAGCFYLSTQLSTHT